MQSKNRKERFIIDKFTEQEGLFDRVFGDRWLALYISDREKLKSYLTNAFWFTDVYDIFPPELDIEKTQDIMKTIFTYYDQQQADSQKSFLWLPK